jgi:hypothetical protein
MKRIINKTMDRKDLETPATQFVIKGILKMLEKNY